MINYWASWCGPCIHEMPILDAFARAQGADGVQVLGVALDNEASVREFLAKLPVSYRIALEIPSGDDSSVRLGNGQNVLRSEEHTSELQSLMRISYAVFCLKKKKTYTRQDNKK